MYKTEILFRDGIISVEAVVRQPSPNDPVTSEIDVFVNDEYAVPVAQVRNLVRFLLDRKILSIFDLFLPDDSSPVPKVLDYEIVIRE